jgi:mycothiol synthase
MTTQTSFKAREFAGEADLQAICDLSNLIDAVDKLDDNHSVEDTRQAMLDPNRDPQRDVRLWEDAAGRLVGFGAMWIPRAQPDADKVDADLYMRIHPDTRLQGLEDEILAWGEARTREVARERGVKAQLFSGAREHYSYGRSVLEAHGYTIARYFYKMERPLDQPLPDPEFPPGYTLRHVNGDADVERWVECFNQSFIDHWGFHPATVERRRYRMADPLYEAELDLVVEAPNGEFAAFCSCRIDPDDNARNNRSEGWVNVLGTRRGHRKIGLGRATLLAGMHVLKAHGVATAVLGVDAENPTGALRLYESVGFHVADTDIAYVRDL